MSCCRGHILAQFDQRDPSRPHRIISAEFKRPSIRQICLKELSREKKLETWRLGSIWQIAKLIKHVSSFQHCKVDNISVVFPARESEESLQGVSISCRWPWNYSFLVDCNENILFLTIENISVDHEHFFLVDCKHFGKINVQWEHSWNCKNHLDGCIEIVIESFSTWRHFCCAYLCEYISFKSQGLGGWTPSGRIRWEA